ncbi:MAG TPA: OmpA family protein [Polyangia bacterium]|nr:OmpA family protein [Polyangia bacterium]
MRHALAFAILLALPSTPARAQDATAPAFSLQDFRPAIDSKGYITVNASSILGHLDFSLGLVGSYAHDVLSLSGQGAQLRVEHLLTPQLQFALGLFKWVEVGLSLPVHIMFGERGPKLTDADPNQNNSLSFSGQFVGDLGLHAKARFINTSKYPVGLALLFSLYAPSGDAKKFLGEGQVTLRPEIIVDSELGRARRFRLALNLGALVRPSVHSYTDAGTTLAGVPDVAGGMPFCAPSAMLGAAPGSPVCGTQQTRALGTQLTYSLGASYALVPQKFDLVGELFGYGDVTGQASASPLEGLLAAKVYLAQKSYFEIGGSAGLVPGMTGSPDFRVFVGFIFEPSIGDRDGDGIKDDVDQCPDDPEDFDDFEDEDGCPDPDNDRDGILDRDDQCPNEPGPVENHGCPVVVHPPEPPSDRDQDGLIDEDDECPEIPGPKENHGCPWLDSDGDGLLDKDDKCPHEYGPKDNGGCPLPNHAKIRRGHILAMNPIFFETAKAIIKPISYPTLDDVADTLRSNQQLLIIEIQGHADERGDDDYNMRLTEDRAAAVKAYLVNKGVSADRLQSHGYGETKPLCRQHAESCWSKNRRVEFVILRRSDNPLPDLP